MQITARVLAAAAAALTAIIAAPGAGADPAGLSTPDHPFSVIDIAALPLPAAHWSPVLGHNRTDAVLAGIAECSADGVPAPADLDGGRGPPARCSSPTYALTTPVALLGGGALSRARRTRRWQRQATPWRPIAGIWMPAAPRPASPTPTGTQLWARPCKTRPLRMR
ncbi:hypothetical protein [Mycolicibacterium aubagnense]|uniref:hypothetical protein n=1 Tax=Mycolicibacterium aubagnense TaxID=319707 RepID=UPI001F45BFD9|nr:hypothetical protein [Mycolicibacterium aubagnense]